MTRAFALSALVLAALGCGDAKVPPSPEAAKAKDKDRMNAPAKQAEGDNLGVQDEGFQGQAARGAGKAGQKPAEGDAAPAQAVPRKIVYHANVEIVVDDLPNAEEALKQLLKKHNGFVAQSELSGSAGSRRTGSWRLRVPVDGFDDFMTEIVKLGVPKLNKTDSQDVTDQFYDLEARIKNRKSEEESLRKLLEQTTGKMEDILSVRRELNQVRGDIDQKEGQLRRLANLSSLTTVNVTLQEIKNYVPPQSPTFGSTVAGTFSSSIDALQSVGKGLVLFGVAIAPWLPIVIMLAVPAWMLLRRRRPLTAVRVVTDPTPAVAPPVT
jgi:hypothetical protein